ncbi:hypothetical protein M885DRAFT_515121 [Pelagophyceae sp. CCMP2097]|nr:hypothetical protein M885DRAFT_515121 [Pelagophyceae sp. CCMP2097]
MAPVLPAVYWHKMEWMPFLMHECRRKETWPFLVGGLCIFMMGVKIELGITEEDRLNSPYHRKFKMGLRCEGH